MSSESIRITYSQAATGDPSSRKSLHPNPGQADIAQDLLRSGGVTGVQVLNEFASVALRKTDLRLDEVRENLHAGQGRTIGDEIRIRDPFAAAY